VKKKDTKEDVYKLIKKKEKRKNEEKNNLTLIDQTKKSEDVVKLPNKNKKNALNKREQHVRKQIVNEELKKPKKEKNDTQRTERKEMRKRFY